jgi:DNA-binding NarL/FixJ family response regulator
MVSAKPELSDAGVPEAAYDPDEGVDSAAIRIILANSQAIYRMGIREIFGLEDDIRVIARVDTLAGLLSAIQRFPTDVILLEANLIFGVVDVIPDLVRPVPQLNIIVQSTQNDEINTVELYRRGVRGIVPCSISPDLLVKCVRKIAAGETWIDNQSINWVIEAYRSQATELASPRTRRFSPKELAIITCITQGQLNKEIASQLGTTEQVIKNYLRKVYDRLVFPIASSLPSIACNIRYIKKQSARYRRRVSLLLSHSQSIAARSKPFSLWR